MFHLQISSQGSKTFRATLLGVNQIQETIIDPWHFQLIKIFFALPQIIAKCCKGTYKGKNKEGINIESGNMFKFPLLVNEGIQLLFLAKAK